MNYFEAKIELLKDAPRVPLKMLALEIVALVAIAGVLVRIFA
jgi:hypothetical protein